MNTINKPGGDDGEEPLYWIKPPGANNDRDRSPVLRIVAVVALVAAAGLIAWFVINRTGSDSASTTTSTTSTPTEPSTLGSVAATPKALTALAASVGHTVYWAGPIAGRKIEFTRTSDGGVYVRYLPKGVAVGDKRPNWLIVATYPFPQAYEGLEKVANGKLVNVPGGRIALVDAGNPQSVHFAYPGADVQGEVYDPSARRALAIATSGRIEPVPDVGQ